MGRVLRAWKPGEPCFHRTIQICKCFPAGSGETLRMRYLPADINKNLPIVFFINILILFHRRSLPRTVFNPINLELKFNEPRLIPASVIGEMKRDLVAKLTDAMIENHRGKRPCRDVRPYVSTETDPDAIPTALMTCHHCIRYANGMCSKETGHKATPLFIRNGTNTFRLEFDCRNCVMRVLAVTD